MKKFLFAIPLLFSVCVFAQTAKIDTDLITQANTTIRDVSTVGGVTRAIQATMHKDVIASKLNKLVIFNTRTADYTLVLTDKDNTIVEMNSASAHIITIPPNASVAFPIGAQISLVRYGAGTVTLAPGAGVTIRSQGGLLAIGNQYSFVTAIQRAANEWYLIGDLQ